MSVPPVNRATGGTEAPTTTTQPSRSGGKSFTHALKKAEGEKLEPVSGHHYARIVGGKRDGMYLNQSKDARAGEAFRLVVRDGREFHVYGSGKDEQVFEVKSKHSSTGGASAPTSSKT